MDTSEGARLRVLHGYAVLDTPPEPNFDRITHLAATIFRLPVCTMAFADTDRHWFKSHHGVDATEMPRGMSFCDETLRSEDGLVVGDAAADDRFRLAPVVAGPPRFRFYAGVPLATPKRVRIGTLCVLDTRPHLDFERGNLGIMAGLAGTAIELLEARSREMELARCTEDLAHLAGHDSLTGLANRRLLRNQMQDALARLGTGEQAAVLYMDLDRFKRVNDTFGHAVGDALLAQVAARLRASLRQTDRAARLGGDEFAVFLDGGRHARQRAAELAARLVRALGVPYDVDGRTICIGVSIGIALGACGPQPEAQADAILCDADTALYQAKADGRGTYRFSRPAMELA